MCLSQYDYQSKASRYRKGLIYLKNMVTVDQKHTKDSQKTENTSIINTKGTNQTTKGRTKRKRKEQRRNQQRNTESMGKLGLKWQ